MGTGSHARPTTGIAKRLAILALLALTGCATMPSDRSGRLDMPDSTHVLSVPAGDRHLVMMRSAPGQAAATATDGTNASGVVCIEPAPDYATSFAAQQAVSASASTPAPVSASASANFSQTATIVALAGRTAGVVALRDGLYQACQAYANGIITRGDYSLILSQYGDLLVALVGQSSGAAGGTPAATAAPSPTLPVTVAVAGAATPAASSGSAASGSSGASQPAASGPAASTLQAVNAHLQAVLVSCLNAFDPEWPRGSPAAGRGATAAAAAGSPAGIGTQPAPDGNMLLTSVRCGALVDNMVGLSGHLLDGGSKPDAGAGASSGCAGPPVPAGVVVKTYQAQLLALGLYAGRLDGKDGVATKRAVKAFQQRNKLCTSGVVDAATARALHVTA